MTDTTVLPYRTVERCLGTVRTLLKNTSQIVGMAAKGSASQMDPEEYLDRYGVTAYFQDALTVLLENQPSSPIAFMSQYFHEVTKMNTPLQRAHRCIQLASPEHDAFSDNLVAAFHAVDSQHPSGGMTGRDLVRLLRLLSTQNKLDISHSILALLMKTEASTILFTDFTPAVCPPATRAAPTSVPRGIAVFRWRCVSSTTSTLGKQRRSSPCASNGLEQCQNGSSRLQRKRSAGWEATLAQCLKGHDCI